LIFCLLLDVVTCIYWLLINNGFSIIVISFHTFIFISVYAMMHQQKKIIALSEERVLLEIWCPCCILRCLQPWVFQMFCWNLTHSVVHLGAGISNRLAVVSCFCFMHVVWIWDFLLCKFYIFKIYTCETYYHVCLEALFSCVSVERFGLPM
jgi:hypothetical protein